MTEKDWLILEWEADESNLRDDNFSEDEIAEIMRRVKSGEDINEVVLDWRNY